MDLVTGKDKIACHLTMDEFHYGTNAHPPGAHAVMDLISPNNLVGGSAMKEDLVKVDMDPKPDVDPKFFGNNIIDTGTSPPQTATAAEMQITEERILHMEPLLDMFGDAIPITMNIHGQRHPHPFLGFKFCTDLDTQLDLPGKLYCENSCIQNSTLANSHLICESSNSGWEKG